MYAAIARSIIRHEAASLGRRVRGRTGCIGVGITFVLPCLTMSYHVTSHAKRSSSYHKVIKYECRIPNSLLRFPSYLLSSHRFLSQVCAPYHVYCRAGMSAFHRAVSMSGPTIPTSQPPQQLRYIIHHYICAIDSKSKITVVTRCLHVYTYLSTMSLRLPRSPLQG
jgi:hypothetical protein